MGETTKHQKALVEFIYRDNAAETTSEKLQLVRVLSRSSTLPKVQNINIQPLSAESRGFYIRAGQSIQIGAGILSNPVIALMYIRYGLEWQIWYKSQSAENFDPRICDLAACQVTAKFYDTIPQDDKKDLVKIPKELAGIFQKFRAATDLPSLSTADFEQLAVMHDKTYPVDATAPEHLEAVRHLGFPLEYLLMSGGDMRLKIDPEHLLNKYGCRPFPRPKAFTFASSTATSISNIAFNQAERKREKLIEACFSQGYQDTAIRFAEEIKAGIKDVLSLPRPASVILAPSGTDISLMFSSLCQTLFKRPVTHILVACDETGSGVPAALKGLHFSGRSSQNVEVTKGDKIEGFAKTATINIALRTDKGILKSRQALDDEVFEAYEKVMQDGGQAVLHAMNQSKLGYSAPSDDCLRDLKERYGREFFVLIDNSQLRMERQHLRNYVEDDAAMTVTGSKFFTGPPFNGALILSDKWQELLRQSDVSLPRGMVDYVYKNDFPADWKSAQNLNKGTNSGTLMRWYASLIELQRYFDTPLSLRKLGTEMFCEHVEMGIAQTDFLEGLSEAVESAGKPLQSKERRTIFPFFIRGQEGVLGPDEVSRVYKLLNQSLSQQFSSDDENIGLLGDQVCHIGQPVKAIYKDGTPSGVVRISLGSRVLSESWKEQDVSLFFQKIEDQMNQVDIIIRKIKLILNHPEWWRDCLN